ncbi:MAG: hypothetical protein QOG26_306, partial [Solirubrobacterales bacterium]|nr:hypothetical protein [Solirubrobacterales bacterium]
GGKLKGGATIGALSASPKVPLVFSVRAASGAPVDPRPLVDGYRLQEVANYYHAVAPLGGNPFLPDQNLNPGGAFSGSDRQLASKVLSDSGIQIYGCGQQDIQHGDVDRRVLGALLFLRRAGMTLTVTSLRCGHGFYTASGNVSAHSYGAAVDIAAFDGQPVVGHQGPGSLTEQAIKLLMQLDGQARPAQLISLMNLGGPSFALADHYDHLHVGYSFQPALGLGRTGDSLGNILFGGSGIAKPHGGKAATKAAKAQARSQERRLSEKLGGIANPRVHKGTGPGSIPVEGEKPSDRAAATRKLHKDLPFETAPTSSGARTVAIDTPDAGNGDEAYAIGVVDGSARGWARKQTVVLAFRDGAWRIVGPPRDARGHIVNPHLRALATVAGGRGYAVGRRGTIVALRGGGSPRLLPPSGHAALRDVVVDGPGSGYAVGSGGALMRIAGKHATREQGAPKSVDFESVTLGGGGDVTAVGAKAANQPAAFQRSGSWQPLNLGFKFEPGSGGTLTAVAARGDQLWVAGSYGPGTGAAGQLPFAARRSAGTWQTFCSIDPALANIRELGNKSSGPCDHGLVTDPGEHGPVADVALTKQGTLLASSSALHLLAPGQTSFRPVPVALSTTSRIEAVPRGRGWLLGSDGRMSRLTPRGQGASLLASPSLGLPLGGKPGAVAVTPSGDRALAFSGARTAVYAGGHWLPGATTQLPVRDAAISGSAAMAIDEMGTLISYGTDGWSVPGADGIQKTARSVFARALGSQPLGAAASAKSSSGLQALTMNSPAEAFAVGAGGVIEHYKLGDWSHEGSPVSTTLRDVAVGPRGAVAVGDHGTLLERSDGSWKLSVDAAKLVRGEGFTAVETLDDGTLLASAGGTTIERGKSDKAWHLAGLTPLGLTVAKLSGYRDHDGHLQAIALAGEGQHLSLLAGDSAGWRPVELPDGLEVTSFARQPGTAVVWIAGWRMGSPVVVHLDLARGKGGNG